MINTVEQMQEEKDYYKCLIAETDDNEIVDMALYYIVYYTWVGKSLYLDDLYVKQSVRGNKIESKLLQELFDVAKSENYKRVGWQVLDWNEPVIKLYKKMGANLDSDWYNCDFDN